MLLQDLVLQPQWLSSSTRSLTRLAISHFSYSQVSPNERPWVRNSSPLWVPLSALSLGSSFKSMVTATLLHQVKGLESASGAQVCSGETCYCPLRQGRFSTWAQWLLFLNYWRRVPRRQKS